MSAKVLLDTDTLSELFKEIDSHVVARGKRYREEHAVFSFTSLSALELLSGLQRKEANVKLKRAEALFDLNEEITPERDDYRLASEIIGKLGRSGYETGFIDPTIAACAIRRGLGVASGNTRHFEFIQTVGYSFHLENWRNP